MIRQLPPLALPGSKRQEVLSPDWRQAVRKIDSRYVELTEAAAKKYRVPPELLARLFYKESEYDKNAGMQRGKDNESVPLGIPQMYKDALKDVGIDRKTFLKADAATQIDAGAAYLARQFDQFHDWPKAVASYHFGGPRLQTWLAGKGPDYQYTSQRIAMEIDKENKPPKTKIDAELNQWRELEGYLPHIFIGDPERYNGPGHR